MGRHSYEVYGLTVRTDLALAGLMPSSRESAVAPTVAVDLVPYEALEERFSGPTQYRVELTVGPSEKIEVDVGRKQDALMRYGEHAWFYVSADGAEVLCAPQVPASAAWRRVLLDTVLGTAARCRGLDGLHAGAVSLAGRVVAISAPSGGGKSTVCAELVRRGARLLADDMVFLTRERGRILAHPGPALMNLPTGSVPTGALGERLAVFEDEEWVTVRNSARSAAPLAGVVLLERNRSAHGIRVQADSSGTALLEIALDSGPSPERLRARFELLGDVSDAARVVRLTAGWNVAPGLLASQVESIAQGLEAGT